MEGVSLSLEEPGSINWFVCQVCDGLTVTINADKGMTPDTLECRADGKLGTCPGWAASAHYPAIGLPPGRLYSVWRWYRPPSGTPVPDAQTLAYLQAGGLLLAPVVLTDKMRAVLAQHRPGADAVLQRNRLRAGRRATVLPDPRSIYANNRQN